MQKFLFTICVLIVPCISYGEESIACKKATETGLMKFYDACQAEKRASISNELDESLASLLGQVEFDKELRQSINESQKTWKSYVDRWCGVVGTMTPFGEKCRLDKTTDRIKEIKNLIEQYH